MTGTATNTVMGAGTDLDAARNAMQLATFALSEAQRSADLDRIEKAKLNARLAAHALTNAQRVANG